MGDPGDGGIRRASALSVDSIFRRPSALSVDSIRRPSAISMMLAGKTIPEQTGLHFENLCVDAGRKRILWSVSGDAQPGRVLAIMGPSGSGKTTLLNTLAGHHPLASGYITLNGHRMTKRIRRKVSYVLQADIFFPNLTLRETLRYSALMRLPRELSFKEKLAKVEEIIETLHLQDCANTLIGNALVRGLSGGEKKRANIGCELLTNPILLYLDEPTSGLDSSSALTLMETLCQLAKDDNKIVVTSIHQPSSQLFHMFDGLLLMAKGKVAYFGEASKALDYFSTLGLHCTLHYNPADYMLELVTKAESRKILIGDDPVQDQAPPHVRSKWQSFLSVFRRRGSATPPNYDADEKAVEVIRIEEYPSSPRVPRKDPLSVVNPLISNGTIPNGGVVDNADDKSSSLSCDSREEKIRNRKWPTRWHWQFLVLTARTFRQSRHVILSKLNFIQTILLAAVVSLIWFQMPQDENSISDRYGYFFFTMVYWGFNPLILSTMSLPAEHVVISKERRSGSYHLSAYYMAKTISELPLLVTLPTLFIIITYWIAGFNSAASFFGVWLVLLVNSVVAQSLGLFIGATVMDFQRSLVVAAVSMLSFMLLGGFYVQRLPSWLHWAQYLSFVQYSFDLALQFEFTSDLTFSCNPSHLSSYSSCNVTDSAENGTISGLDVLEQLNANELPVYINFIALFALALIFRILAYFSLRFLHRKHS